MANVLLKAMPLYALFFAAFCAAAEPVKIATPGHGLFDIPVVVAIRNGYFRKEGLEVESIQIQPQIAVKAIVAGEVDYILGWGSPVRAAMMGIPIKVVVTMAARPLHILIARPEIRFGRDLKGKTLGVDSFGGTVDYLSRVAARYLGLEPDRDVEIVETGDRSLRLAALKEGSIDAAVIDAVFAVKAEQEGFRRLLHLGEILDLPVSGIAVTAGKLATQREQIKKFIRATLRGARFIKRNRPDTVRIIQSYLRITPSQAAQTYDSSVRFFTDDGFVSDRAVSLDVRRAKEELNITKDPSLSQVADWSLLREIKLEQSRVPFWLKNYER
jgi:NitT/TauT family transport system substrate-binding protein